MHACSNYLLSWQIGKIKLDNKLPDSLLLLQNILNSHLNILTDAKQKKNFNYSHHKHVFKLIICMTN